MDGMGSGARTGKLWNRTFLFCMLISGLANMSNGMLSPALPIYVTALGRGTEIAGTIVAVATFLSMFGRGLSGGWSDKYSRKTIILVCLISTVAAFLLFCFADSIPLLVLAKCLQGVSSGIITTVLCTIAYDTLPPELLGSGIGMFALAGSLAQCIAPSIGTALAKRGMYTTLFASSAAAAAVSFLILLTIPVELTAKAKRWQEAKRNGTAQRRGFHISDYLCRPAFPAAFLLIMNGIIHAAISNFLAHCGLSRGIESIALFFTINSIVLIVARPLCGRISDRRHIGWLIIPGYIAMGAACLLIATAKNMVPIVIAAVLYGFGFGATMATSQLWAIRAAGPDQRSTANSTYYVGGDIGLALGAYVAGALAAAVNYTVMYAIIAAVCAFSMLWFIAYVLLRRKTARGMKPVDMTEPAQ